MIPSAPSNKAAWVQLYEARRASAEVKTRTPGRPTSAVPRKKVGVTLSQGEIHELEEWQERLSTLMRRKVSLGETVGILARLCSARFSHLEDMDEQITWKELSEFVDKMIG
jgi:hypothetical protein